MNKNTFNIIYYISFFLMIINFIIVIGYIIGSLIELFSNKILYCNCGATFYFPWVSLILILISMKVCLIIIKKKNKLKGDKI
jgi:hypothetical protein